MGHRPLLQKERGACRFGDHPTASSHLSTRSTDPVTIGRNRWSPCPGTGGHHRQECPVTMPRCAQSGTGLWRRCEHGARSGRRTCSKLSRRGTRQIRRRCRPFPCGALCPAECSGIDRRLHVSTRLCGPQLALSLSHLFAVSQCGTADEIVRPPRLVEVRHDNPLADFQYRYMN